LEERRVRVLHNRSFVDDPTRMYRAVRYEQRLRFRIDRATIALLPEGGRWVQAVSGARLRNELDLILMEGGRSAALKRLSRLGLLRRIHPALPADAGCLRRMSSQHLDDQATAQSRAASNALLSMWMLWLMDLGPAAMRSIGQRLVWNRKEAESISAAADVYRTARTWVKWRPSKLTGKLDMIPRTAVETVCAALPVGRERQMLEQYLHSWRHLRARATGRDLEARGLTPGPRFRSILEALRAAWIDGAVRDAHGESLLLERLTGRAPSSEQRSRGPRQSRRARRS
jgi:tRNA nucleotidyltransferase (CCA-adding enzyme)